MRLVRAAPISPPAASNALVWAIEEGMVKMQSRKGRMADKAQSTRNAKGKRGKSAKERKSEFTSQKPDITSQIFRTEQGGNVPLKFEKKTPADLI